MNSFDTLFEEAKKVIGGTTEDIDHFDRLARKTLAECAAAVILLDGVDIVQAETVVEMEEKLWARSVRQIIRQWAKNPTLVFFPCFRHSLEYSRPVTVSLIAAYKTKPSERRLADIQMEHRMGL